MILVVGPTGSGKTTTLSSALTAVRSEKTNIITIEDPIEYQIPGVNQTQINEKIKLTFASALRSILRQDPDVILVGEIRDSETAKIAMQAAQTGHLVLSTLHTDDAPSTVTRLIDIGAEPYVIASALIGVVAQRLVRRLCVHCRRQYTPAADTLRALNIADADAAAVPFYKAVGCDQCNHTGYRGRIGIYEVMRVTDKLRRLIASRAPEDQIREAALGGGMISLGEDGLAKVKSGVTTPEELLRVVTEVREMRTLCSGCGAAVGVDFRACPHCGKRLGGGCPHCGRALQPGWSFCPYCARSTREQARPQAAPRSRETNAGSCPPPTSRNSRSSDVAPGLIVTLKNYYELLAIEPTASPEDVKRAFRQQIARYHPDKVQHLGSEFQEMAAERAAELTEAYRVLSDAGRRAEYDRARDGRGRRAVPAPAAVRPDAVAVAAAPPPAVPLRSRRHRRQSEPVLRASAPAATSSCARPR